MGPNPISSILIKRGKFGHMDTYTEDGHVKSETDWSDAATRCRMLRMAASTRSWEKQGKTLP